jgi:Arc/MetJ-type ribon-helix-helix transcriptional regulator
VHLRKSQLAALDQLADAEHTSRAELVREAIDLLLKRLKRAWQLRAEGANVCVTPGDMHRASGRPAKDSACVEPGNSPTMKRR